MQLSLSWGAASSIATREFPNMLCNPNVYYYVHKSPLLVPFQRHVSQVHMTPFSLSPPLMYIVILTFRLWTGFHSGNFFLFYTETCRHSSSTSFLLHALPFQSSFASSLWLCLAKSISYESHYAVYSKLLSLQFSARLFSRTRSLCSILTFREQVSHPQTN
jgi:hypothetical protein